jgi:hypothetical protein
MGRTLVVVALGVGVTATAVAEPVRVSLDPRHASISSQPAAPGSLPDMAEIEGGTKWSWRLAEKMTLAGDELGLHLRAVTFNSIDVNFDGHKRIAHLRLQAGEAKKVALGIDGDVAFKKGYARVNATVHLGMAGKIWRLELPEFDMVPRSWDGNRYVELRLPVIDLRF